MATAARAETGGRDAGVLVRREWRAGDGDALVALHARLYPAEHGMDERFVEGVRSGVRAAQAGGFPSEREAAWVVEDRGRFAGCVALTYEGGGVGRLRWVLLAPELRGRGLGRSLIADAVAEARRLGILRLELDTFAALEAAGHIYTDLGFRLISERRTEMWGPEIRFRRYELEL